MGLLVTEESRSAELEEFRRLLLSSAYVDRRKNGGRFTEKYNLLFEYDGCVNDRLVCVTSGVSYLGIAIVNHLLFRGYSVRIIVDKEEDVETLREMEISGEMRHTNRAIEIAVAKLGDVDSLVEAFNGCCGVFHTSAFVDPAGLSGYTKSMVNIEEKTCENVMKASEISGSVVYCVLTSSLLTCIWHDDEKIPCLIDHNSFSNESFCINNKLWYALGKLRAEKAAFEIAKRSGLKLVTICHGLITSRNYILRNPTPTIAYLKGARQMYTRGLLATVDIDTLAKAHLVVFEEMKKSGSGSGRYIWFDKVIENEDDLQKVVNEAGINLNGSASSSGDAAKPRFQLSKSRLHRLLITPHRCNK